MEVGLSEGVEGGDILCKGPEAELSVCSRRSKRPETLMLGKIKEEKWATENEMVRCHHRLNEHEFEQSLGESEGQGSLACCNLWGCKELDMTE